MKIIIIITLFLIFNTIFLSSCKDKDSPLTGKTKYIVFTNAFFWGEASNSAILVMNESEIRTLEKLYDNEPKDLYKCGYDYQIHFFDGNNNSLYSRIINTECDIYSKHNDEIQVVINSLTNKIKNNPTDYIFNCKVNIHIPADSVINLLKNDGLQTFLLSQQNKQYPQLIITYCEPYEISENLNDAEKKFKEIMQNIKFNIHPIDSSYIMRTTSTRTKYVDFKTNKISCNYHFPSKTNIDLIIKQIDDMKIDYLFAELCSEYYYLQLLSKDSIEEVSSKLNKYSFIKDIRKANDGFVYQDCD